MRSSSFLFVLLAFLLALPLRAAPVDPSAAVYPFLRRMEMKGFLPPAFLSTLPLGAGEIRRLLEALSEQEEKLRDADRRELARHRAAFGLAPDPRPWPPVYGDGFLRLEARPFYGLQILRRDSLPVDDSRFFHHAGLGFDGDFPAGFSFVTEGLIAQEFSSHPRYVENYEPSRGLPFNTPDTRKTGSDTADVASFDAFRTVLAYEHERFRLEGGLDWNEWGPGLQHPSFSRTPFFWVQDSSSRTAERGDSAWGRQDAGPAGGYRRGYRWPGEGPPLPLVRGTFMAKNFRYTKVNMRRSALKKGESVSLTADKLDFAKGPFSASLLEMVAYRRDGEGEETEWLYVLPLVPLFLAQHQLGDRDNVALGLSLEYRLFSRGRVYGELFLDDLLSPGDFFRNYWGNKYAASLGAEALDLFFDGSRLQVEYARVEPWLFTHHVEGNLLQHQGALLGSLLPPNSHALFVEGSVAPPPWPDLRFTLSYRFLAHQHAGRGSSVLDVHREEEGLEKTFLGRGAERRNALALETRYGFQSFVETAALVGYEGVENWESRPGLALNGILLGLTLRLRY